MQKITELKLREIKTNLNKKREDEEAKLAASMTARGLSNPGAYIRNLLTTEYNYIEKLLDSIFETEKAALTHNKGSLPDDYFINLKDEILKILQREIDIISSRVATRFQRGDNRIGDSIRIEVYQKGVFYKDSISKRVDIIQEEIKLGMQHPPQNTTIHIEGDVGAINTGTVYGSVQGEINKIRESVDSKIADLFDKLLDTISASDITDTTKKEQQQNVEFLVQQYLQHTNKRNYGLVNASLTLLSAATNLSTLWAQYGQALIDIFKK